MAHSHRKIAPSMPVSLHLKCKRANIHVKVVHGNITESEVDCIVNSAPGDLLDYSGCAGMVRRAGGHRLVQEVQTYIETHGRLKSGAIAVKSGGDIPYCRMIIHACGPSWSVLLSWIGLYRRYCMKQLVDILNLCLDRARDCESIAIPGVSGGKSGGVTDLVAEAICQSVTEFCQAAEKTPCTLRHIVLVDVNESMVQGMLNAFQNEVGHTFVQTDFDEEIAASRRGVGFQGSEMQSTTNTEEHLPGYEDCGTITIVYDIPSGTQSNPTRQYRGVRRTAYLPDSVQGRRILDFMDQAFTNGFIFTIGQSKTTGSSDVVVWSGKDSHRTSQTGGPTKYGYPDPDYLDKVERELADLGIL